MKFKSILLLFFAVSTLACTNNNKKVSALVKNNIIQKDDQYNDIVWRDYNRVIGLLSIKYSIPDTVVKYTILEYLRINKPSNYFSLTMDDKNRDTTVFDYLIKPKESIGNTVKRLNLQYGIGQDTISSLLFDFEIWLQAK
jgi:hypothetical protein